MIVKYTREPVLDVDRDWIYSSSTNYEPNISIDDNNRNNIFQITRYNEKTHHAFLDEFVREKIFDETDFIRIGVQNNDGDWDTLIDRYEFNHNIPPWYDEYFLIYDDQKALMYKLRYKEK